MTWALVVGCGPTAETVGDDLQTATCARFQRCDAEAFDAVYDSFSECTSTGENAIDALQSCFAKHCEGFDGAAAASILADYATRDCDDTLPNTQATLPDIYSDCHNVDLGLCVVGEGFN